MTAARVLIEAATAAGARFEVSGDRLRVTAPRPLPDAVVTELRRAKSDILRLILPSADDAAERVWWRDQYAARIARRFRHGHCGWQDAERLAFGELVVAWHQQRGAPATPGRCAGCGNELTDAAILDVGAGSRVHFDGIRGVDCLITFGQRWRGAALVGLRLLGVEPPQGFDLL